MDDLEELRPAYVNLATQRPIDRPDWPVALTAFYARREGVGLEDDASDAECPVRLAMLSEVKAVGWAELDIGSDMPHSGWAAFSGFLIGRSDAGDTVVFVTSAPTIAAGSILVFASDAFSGPPGEDVNGPVGALLLAESLPQWIDRLERFGPLAHGIYLDADLPKRDRDAIRREIVALNPFCSLAG